MMNFQKIPREKLGSALLIILAFVTLITMLAVSLLFTTRFERSASSLALGRAQADTLADYAADLGMQRLRDAIDTGRQFGAGSFTTWASEPGRIHIFTITQGTGAIARTARDMFSAPPGPDADAANVDLNKASLSGIRPITGTAPGVMKVGWINILADPGQPASKANPANARIAYWVDDESCKVNVNTADGSRKVLYNSNGSVKSGDLTRSFGFGTPSEISLGAFGITSAAAASIADFAASHGFNSTAEVEGVAGVPANFYDANKFNLTYTSRSPEINMFGEPKIYLFPVQKYATSAAFRTVATGGYGNYADWVPAGEPVASFWKPAVVYENCSNPINFIYPNSALTPIVINWMPLSQLPTTPASFTGTVELPLPQCLTTISGAALYPQGTSWNSWLNNYPLGMRIAKYLGGFNSQNQVITWPRFSGSTVNGFAGKYSTRQLDSIALQIIDLADGKNVMPDQGWLYSQPSYMARGFLHAADTAASLVYGLGRSPKANEIQIVAGANSGSTAPVLTIEMMLECFLPPGYAGPALRYISDFQFDSDGAVHIPHSFNQQDRPYFAHGTPASGAIISSLDSWWMNEILQIKDQSGTNFSGIDLTGWPAGDATTPLLDRDQTLAAAYHPFVPNSGPGTYVGENNSDRFTSLVPLLGMTAPSGGDIWAPGVYHASPNTYGAYSRRAAPTVTEFKFRGGLALWTRTPSGGGNFWEVTPLDGMRGSFTGEGGAWRANGHGEHWTGSVDPAVKSIVTEQAVIPVHFDLPVPGGKTYTLQVSDPLVNKFPADWISVPTGDSTIPARTGAYAVPVYSKNGATSPDSAFPYPAGYTPTTLNGDNPGYTPAGGGDPLSVWLPKQDIRVPKQARLPSVGALNAIRTGMIPDDETVPLQQQHGTPWRSLSFDATSGGQATSRGRYPDWAMLDLFTVPFLPQLPYIIDFNSGAGTPTQLRVLTSGGSTEGRLNINNPKNPYPFSSAENFPGVQRTPYPERTLPLQALFYGIEPSNSYGGAGDPIYTAIDAGMIADRVQTFLATNGAFMLPGQLAEIPDIAAFTYTGVGTQAQSRNDLMKSVVGAATTQSNTFSIWVVAQTFKKAAKNTDYSKFEPGDIVTGEVRKRVLVERFIETGKDGVPGNANALNFSSGNPTNDAILGTSDDPIDPIYNPAMTYPLPYRWKILSSENITL